MTDNQDHCLVRTFPWPDTPALVTAYNLLVAASTADDATKLALGNPAKLARPWDPPTCTDRQLRAELWIWLDQFVTWFNHEYVWDHTAGGIIPACWPHHPHLVHEIAVLADQRRRAGLDLTSGSLEEWHRYSIPNFIDRLRGRTGSLCDEGHADWPAAGRHQRHISRVAADDRSRLYANDVNTLAGEHEPDSSSPRPRLRLVDEDGAQIDPYTGEIL
jgi:hypothetical protein